MDKHPAIIQQVYDLLLYLIPLLQKFPRNQKFVLADRIQNALTNILEAFLRAYYHPKGENKKAMLHAINVELDILRFHIRLAKDLHFIDVRRYEIIQQKIHEIGVQNGAWIKSMT